MAPITSLRSRSPIPDPRPEDLADDRSVGEHRLAFNGKGVHARGDAPGLKPAGNLGSRTKPPRALHFDEQALVLQEAHELLGVEGVTLRAFGDRLLELGRDLRESNREEMRIAVSSSVSGAGLIRLTSCRPAANKEWRSKSSRRAVPTTSRHASARSARARGTRASRRRPSAGLRTRARSVCSATVSRNPRQAANSSSRSAWEDMSTPISGSSRGAIDSRSIPSGTVARAWHPLPRNSRTAGSPRAPSRSPQRPEGDPVAVGQAAALPPGEAGSNSLGVSPGARRRSGSADPGSPTTITSCTEFAATVLSNRPFNSARSISPPM